MKVLLILLFPLYAFSQSYEKSKDEYLKESYVRYYDRDAGIIIQKTIPFNNDTAGIFYEVALIMVKGERSIDDIMKKRGVIVFDDKSILVFYDQVSFDFLMEGKRQYSVKHRLTNDELFLLQTKIIDLINLVGVSNKLDKWQKQTYLKVFTQITRQ